MKKISLVLLFVAILSFGISVFAQNSSEKTYTDKSGGYSFAAPSGFTISQNEKGFALVDGAKTYLILVSPHRYDDAKSFAADANLERDGLTLVGEIQKLNNGDFSFRTYKDTAQGRLIVDSFVLFSPYGGGVLVVAMADTEKANTAFQNALQISKTAKFAKPEESESSSQWQSFLRGKHLLYLYTGNGYSERKDIYLCSNGDFIFKNDASSVSVNGTGALGSNASGTWKVSGASLILNFNNGNVSEYKITTRQASNEIGLNGNRYFVQNDGTCR